MTLEEQIKNKALEVGFDAVGITDASPIASSQLEHFQKWLAQGCAGQMEYLQRNLDKRFHPALLLDGAQSVIVVGLGYKPFEGLPVGEGRARPFGRVAQYACYDDYHSIIKSLLHRLAETVGSLMDRPCRFKACVDSAPLAERALAVRAGLGFIGRSHLLIHPTFGPQVFLGELLTTVRLQPDQPEPDGADTTHCVSCDRCVRACPTGALQDDGWFDARKCVSYLTIEHKGEIELDLAAKLGNRLFGCDECMLACPYQRSAPVCGKTTLKYHPDEAALDLREVLKMDEGTFADRFGDSPLSRAGLASLQRNAHTCLRNLP
jgi:epoxyqueuosine reductase